MKGFIFLCFVEFMFFLVLSKDYVTKQYNEIYINDKSEPFEILIKEIVYGKDWKEKQLVQNITYQIVMYFFDSFIELIIIFKAPHSALLFGIFHCITHIIRQKWQYVGIYCVRLVYLYFLLRPRTINYLPKSFLNTKYSPDISKEECAICKDDDGCNYIVPGCEHYFHEKCLLEWCKKNPVCPLCQILI